MRLVLQGGDRLSGEILEEDRESVTLRTGFGAVLEIPRSEILSLVMIEEQPEIEVDPAVPASPPIGVTGELEVGAALVSSERNRHDYLVDLDLQLTRGGDRLRLQGLVDIQRAEGRALRNRRQAIVTMESEFSPPYFVAVSGRYLRDPPIGLERRTSALALLGRQIFDSDQHYLAVRAGPGFAEERRSDGRSWVTPLVGWGIEYRLGFTGLLERFSLRHSQEGSVDPRGRPVRMLLETETALRYRISDNLFLALSGKIDFDSLSPDATRTLERRLQLRVGFGW